MLVHFTTFLNKVCYHYQKVPENVKRCAVKGLVMRQFTDDDDDDDDDDDEEEEEEEEEKKEEEDDNDE